MENHILVISPTFPPDVGGVETYMEDLVRAFQRHPEHRVTVSTHKPIVTQGVKTYQSREVVGSVTIYRHWWLSGLFHRLEKYPLVQFLYLVPYLFLRTLLLCLFKVGKPNAILSHGMSGSLIGVWLKKIFRCRLVVQTHAVYEINPQSLTAKFMRRILSHADGVLCLSDASQSELKKIGVPENLLHRFRYWIQLDRFPVLPKSEAKRAFPNCAPFVVLFVGRMLEKKGIKLLWDVAKALEKKEGVEFWFVGAGPDEALVQDNPLPNIRFFGKIDNRELYRFYAAADVFCIPSLYEEGFGRVILEALACGTPVVGSKRGGIPEVVIPEVGRVVEPTVENFRDTFLELENNHSLYASLQSHARAYIEKCYSERNFEEILSWLS